MTLTYALGTLGFMLLTAVVGLSLQLREIRVTAKRQRKEILESARDSSFEKQKLNDTLEDLQLRRGILERENQNERRAHKRLSNEYLNFATSLLRTREDLRAENDKMKQEGYLGVTYEISKGISSNHLREGLTPENIQAEIDRNNAATGPQRTEGSPSESLQKLINWGLVNERYTLTESGRLLPASVTIPMERSVRQFNEVSEDIREIIQDAFERNSEGVSSAGRDHGLPVVNFVLPPRPQQNPTRAIGSAVSVNQAVTAATSPNTGKSETAKRRPIQGLGQNNTNNINSNLN